MAQDTKRVLVVDDNMVDRMIIKSILTKPFEIIEADSGNKAFELVSTKRDKLDAILLDLSMPHIDGFDVLSFMKEKGIDEIPIFVVTTESTKKNVTKAFQYNISGFIKKPYDHEDVIRRLRAAVGVIPEYDLEKKELQETNKYIEELENVYRAYLTNFEKSDANYRKRSDLMRILLDIYQSTEGGKDLNADCIALISKAAYFCDIGEILIPDQKQMDLSDEAVENRDRKELHTILGADFIRLNRSKACSYFVEICAGMCMHHHERYDGRGYHGIKGKGNAVFNQLCRIADEIVERFAEKTKPLKFIIGHLANDSGGVASQEVCELLRKCEPLIINYYK